MLTTSEAKLEGAAVIFGVGLQILLSVYAIFAEVNISLTITLDRPFFLIFKVYLWLPPVAFVDKTSIS